MKLTIYRHLRIDFMIAWGIVWNALLGVGLGLDHHVGSHQSIYFNGMSAVAALGTSLLCLSILCVPRMHFYALRKEVTIPVVRRDLWFLIVLTGFLGSASAIGLIWGGQHA
jgi:hypothetical protein